MTNLPEADYSASDIAQLYRARWEVELLFKELKSTYNLDQIPTSNPVAVEALIFVALISLVVSRVLPDLLRDIVDRDTAGDDSDDPLRIPRQRWSPVFSRYGGLILRRIAAWLGYDPPEEHLLELLLAAAIDPNSHLLTDRGCTARRVRTPDRPIHRRRWLSAATSDSWE